MKIIDQKSQEFIEWVKKQNLHQVMAEIIDDLDQYYLTTPLSELKPALIEKMEKGAKEHGPLKQTLSEIENELTFEALDLIGWTLMWKYVQKNMKGGE